MAATKKRLTTTQTREEDQCQVNCRSVRGNNNNNHQYDHLAAASLCARCSFARSLARALVPINHSAHFLWIIFNFSPARQPVGRSATWIAASCSGISAHKFRLPLDYTRAHTQWRATCRPTGWLMGVFLFVMVSWSWASSWWPFFGELSLN